VTDPVKDMSLADIEALLAKTTPGEWQYSSRLSGSENHKGFSVRGSSWLIAEVMPLDEDGIEGEPNAEFITLSKQIVQSLIRRVRAYREVAIRSGKQEAFEAGVNADVEENVDAEAERLLSGQEEKRSDLRGE
jgi:hypothetical protein